MMSPPSCTEQVLGIAQPIKSNLSSLKMLDGLGEERKQDSLRERSSGPQVELNCGPNL